MSDKKEELSDSYLIAEFLKGDDDAFGTIIDKYQKRIYYLALKFLKNEDAAQEVTQETFIRLYQNISAFKGKSNLYTYIYRIAINNCKNYYRTESKYNFASIFDSSQLQLVSQSSPFRILKSKEELIRVLEIIDKLPDRQKTTFMLRAFDDLPFKEIAEIMGCSINSALVNYHLAIKKIFKEWKKSDL